MCMRLINFKIIDITHCNNCSQLSENNYLKEKKTLELSKSQLAAYIIRPGAFQND